VCKYISSSIANFKCTPSDRQMYLWMYMYPGLGTPGLECNRQHSLLKVLNEK